MGQHEDLAGLGVLDDRGQQAASLGEIRDAFDGVGRLGHGLGLGLEVREPA